MLKSQTIVSPIRARHTEALQSFQSLLYTSHTQELPLPMVETIASYLFTRSGRIVVHGVSYVRNDLPEPHCALLMGGLVVPPPASVATEGVSTTQEMLGIPTAVTISLTPTRTHQFAITVLHTAALMGYSELIKECNPAHLRFGETRDRMYHVPVIHMAARGGHTSILMYLNAINPDFLQVRSKNFMSMTAAHLASRYGHVDALRYILSQQPQQRTQLDDLKRSIAHMAAESGSVEMIQYVHSIAPELTNAPDAAGTTPLVHAVQVDSAEGVALLTDLTRASLDDPYFTRFEAGRHKSESIAQCAVRLSSINVLQWLYDLNNEVSRNLFFGSNAFLPHYAVQYGNIGVLIFLRRIGCDMVGSKNDQGKTPLDVMAERLRGTHDGVRDWFREEEWYAE